MRTVLTAAAAVRVSLHGDISGGRTGARNRLRGLRLDEVDVMSFRHRLPHSCRLRELRIIHAREQVALRSRVANAQEGHPCSGNPACALERGSRRYRRRNRMRGEHVDFDDVVERVKAARQLQFIWKQCPQAHRPTTIAVPAHFTMARDRTSPCRPKRGRNHCFVFMKAGTCSRSHTQRPWTRLARGVQAHR